MNILFSEKAIPNYCVWAITLSSTYVMKISDASGNNQLVYYFLSECTLWFVLGVLLTAAIQFGLEKLGSTKTIFVKSMLLVILMLIASVFFNFI